MNEKTVVFIDAGFLSKLSRHLGDGKYLKYDIFKLVEIFANKEKLEIEHIYYYNAPPYTSPKPSPEESKRKENYDSFIKKIKKNQIITIKEGRCQRIKENNKYKYTQKEVDILLAIGLIQVPMRHKHVNKVILIACDSDFVPAIKDLQSLDTKVILFTYYETKRNTNFSRSNELFQVVSKYALITKKDFENSCLSEKILYTKTNQNFGGNKNA